MLGGKKHGSMVYGISYDVYEWFMMFMNGVELVVCINE